MPAGSRRPSSQKKVEVVLVNLCDLKLKGFRNSLNSRPGATAFMLIHQ